MRPVRESSYRADMRLRDSSIDEQVRERLTQMASDWPIHRPGEDMGPLDADGEDAPRRRPWSWQPDSRAFRAMVAVIAALTLVGAWNWWQGTPREVTEVSGVLAPAAGDESADPGALTGDVVVHVAGAVSKPGLIRLPAGARVADAIEAAGGPRGRKALDSVNLARPVVDGEQILVGAAAPGDSAAGLSLNAASAADLEDLPGIGPVLAQRIVAWRNSNGPFRSVDELSEVSGIGDALMAQLRSEVRV